MFGLLLPSQLGLRCKVTHKMRPRCLHDMSLVSRLWFNTEWLHYLLFIDEKSQHTIARSTTSPRFRLTLRHKMMMAYTMCSWKTKLM